MIKWEVIHKPVTVLCREIISIGEKIGTPWDDCQYRECIVDGDNGNEKIPVMEYYDRLLKIGDHVHYDVSIDDFRVVDVTVFDTNPKLRRVK